MRTTTRFTLIGAIVSASLLFGAQAATAAVTFDPATGSGFVGKGDVQLAFGWNNADLQSNAPSISFSYIATTTYVATCTYVTGAGTRGERTHHVPVRERSTVDDAIAFTARKHSQIDGFILTGYQGTTTDGEVPVVGGSCLGQGVDGTYSAVSPGVVGEGGLHVEYPGLESVLIYSPPAG